MRKTLQPLCLLAFSHTPNPTLLEKIVYILFKKTLLSSKEQEEEERHFVGIYPGKEPEKSKPLSETSKVPNLNFLHDESIFLR